MTQRLNFHLDHYALISTLSFPQLATLDLFSLASTNSMASYHRISKLSMAGNLLDNLDTTNLPKALEHLDLSNNLLTEIDTAGLPVHLKHLALAGNQVQQLSNENLAHFSKEGLTVGTLIRIRPHHRKTSRNDNPQLKAAALPSP